MPVVSPGINKNKNEEEQQQQPIVGYIPVIWSINEASTIINALRKRSSIMFNARPGLRRTAFLDVVENVTVSVCEEWSNAQRCRRFSSWRIVIFIDARGRGIEAVEPAVELIAAGRYSCPCLHRCTPNNRLRHNLMPTENTTINHRRWLPSFQKQERGEDGIRLFRCPSLACPKSSVPTSGLQT